MTLAHAHQVVDDDFRADALERTVQTALVAHALAGGGAKPKRKVPRARYPMTTEREYGNRLVAIVRKLRELYAPLFAALPQLLAATARVYGDRADTGEAGFARRVLAQIKARARALVSESEMEALARFYGGRTSQAQRAELAAQLRAGLGIDIPVGDPASDRELLEYFAHENAQLISTLPDDLHKEVANLTMRAFTKRMNPETLRKLLEERFDISEGKARFLARDQIGKLNGQLAVVRMRSLGIRRYTWETMGDNRVRPTHKARRRKMFDMDNPPKGGHPGEDFGCRCTAIPDLSEVVAAVAARRMHTAPTMTTRGTNRIRYPQQSP